MKFLIISILFLPAQALAEPEHGFLNQTFNVIHQLGGFNFQLQLASIILIIIGTMKLSVFRPLWDRFGRYKALVAPALSLFAGILMLPQLSLQGLVAYLISGAGAIVLHELLDAVKALPGISVVWIMWIDMVSKYLYRPVREEKQEKKDDSITDRRI